jgi:DNA-binding NarL/FixJ family response regulator
MKPPPFATSVLLIDGSQNQRAYWAEQLKRGSPNYQIVEAPDGQSGLDLYRSRKIDCVVMELALPDRSGMDLLTELVPVPSKPTVAVIVLTLLSQRTLWELAKQYGAYTCLYKKSTAGEDLDRVIQQAIAFVEQRANEDRYRPV